MEMQRQFSEKPEGVFGFEISGNSNIILNKMGNFRVPSDFQDEDGQLSVRKIQDMAGRGMTKYTYSRFPSLNSDGEYLERISMKWKH